MSQRLKDIKTELKQLKLDEGIRQADVLNDIIDDYHSVVETRFFGKPNSPVTYLSAARTVQKHGLWND